MGRFNLLDTPRLLDEYGSDPEEHLGNDELFANKSNDIYDTNNAPRSLFRG
ncbi:hypothetical protein DPMN_156794 [Dreissena polymorpha]|uniref:Uncharacterized protein n=1 Tax=Dreissena polymorpha TaxID=45954 RepID=A0A9D4FPL6_DREPO|nr:hypothetical protein DPMN_156794 [Dreissena polymorpha]